MILLKLVCLLTTNFYAMNKLYTLDSRARVNFMNLCRSKPAVCVKFGKSGKYPYMRQRTPQSFFVVISS